MLRLVTTLIASEVERVRAPERASEEAATAFQRAALEGRIHDRDDLVARGKELGTDLAAGGSVVVVRGHPRSATRGRLAPAAAGGRHARGAVDRSRRDRLARPRTTPARSCCWSPIPTATPAAGWPARSAASSSPACRDSRSRSGAAATPTTRSRSSAPATRRCSPPTSSRATPSAPSSAFEETGTYQLLLPHMSDPAELKRFYSETVRPLVAYDEQYETDLLGTLSTFLDCDANVNATAARLYHPPPHDPLPVRARARADRARRVLDRRAREAVARAQGDARARASPRRGGPATEPGAEGGRVPR